MAYSIQTAVSDGTLEVLDLSIKYMDKSHIFVYVDDVLVDGSSYNYTWLTDTRIQVAPAVASGSTLKVIRKTLTDEMWHEFSKGARFSTLSMDENFEQLLFLAQEYSEGIYISDFYTDLDLHLHRILNLADPIADGDAVNLKTLKEYLPNADLLPALIARIAAEEAKSLALVRQGMILADKTIVGFDSSNVPDGAWIHFAGRASVGDGGGGWLRFSLNNTTPANGGTVYAVSNGRLLREDWQEATPAWFADVTSYQAAGFSTINVDAPPYNGNLVAAYNAIPAEGKVVLLLGKRTYNILGMPDNVKPYVAILGAGLPVYDNTLRKLVDGTGTILQGSVYNFAKGFWIDNLGIDRGEWVRNNLAAGVYRDTLVNIDFGNEGRIRYGNLVILQSEVVLADPASYTHCILTERGTHVYQTGPVEVIDGYHGHVVKVAEFHGQGHPTIAKYQYGDAAIIKSDAGAKTRNVRMGDIIIDGDASRWSAGVLIEAQTQSLDDVTFGRIIAKHARWVLVEAAATNAPIVGVTVEGIKGSLISGIGAGAAYQVGSHFVDFKCGWHQLNSCDQGGVHVRPGAVEVDIGSGFSKNSSGGDGYKFEADTKHGQISAVTNAGWGVNNISNKLLNAQDVMCKDNTAGGISVLQTVPVTFQNSWTDAAGTFRFSRYGSMVRVSGNLLGGTVGSDYTWVTVATISSMLPVFTEYFSCLGYESGGAPKPMAARLTNTGELQVYGLAPQGVIGFIVSGTYVCQGNQ